MPKLLISGPQSMRSTLETRMQLHVSLICQPSPASAQRRHCRVTTYRDQQLRQPIHMHENWKIGLDDLASGNHTDRSTGLRPETCPRVVKRQPPCEALVESAYYCHVPQALVMGRRASPPSHDASVCFWAAYRVRHKKAAQNDNYPDAQLGPEGPAFPPTSRSSRTIQAQTSPTPN